ncbi:MAG: IS701 family transposase, partial [Terriglobales bacterium]
VFVVSSFAVVLQELAVVMTVPSFRNFLIIVTGWIFSRRRTVTGMLTAAGVAGKRHHAAFHRLFAAARWSLDALGLAVFRLLEPLLSRDTIFLAVDDTLARKRGLKVFGVGMHHDPILSSRRTAITNWGHSWVVLGVIVRLPLWPERALCLPILFRMYLNHDASERARRRCRTRPELAVEMLEVLCNHRKNRRFHVLADSAYGGQSVLCHLPANCDLTSRLVLNARLHAAPPLRKPGSKGRPRKRGVRLPTPAQMLQARSQRMSLNVYGRRDRVRAASAVACVYAAPSRLLRIVAVEPLSGGREKQAFYSTCSAATALEVLTWYAWRWSIEVAFHDSKQHLGFEEPQGWSRRAAERTAPVAMLLYSLIVYWFATEGHRHWRPQATTWYIKPRASFGDMLATLRRESLREQSFAWGLTGPGSQKILQSLENTLALAT